MISLPRTSYCQRYANSFTLLDDGTVTLDTFPSSSLGNRRCRSFWASDCLNSALSGHIVSDAFASEFGCMAVTLLVLGSSSGCFSEGDASYRRRTPSQAFLGSPLRESLDSPNRLPTMISPNVKQFG
jgi:hypothetical protein